MTTRPNCRSPEQIESTPARRNLSQSPITKSAGEPCTQARFECGSTRADHLQQNLQQTRTFGLRLCYGWDSVVLVSPLFAGISRFAARAYNTKPGSLNRRSQVRLLPGAVLSVAFAGGSIGSEARRWNARQGSCLEMCPSCPDRALQLPSFR